MASRRQNDLTGSMAGDFPHVNTCLRIRLSSTDPSEQTPSTSAQELNNKALHRSPSLQELNLLKVRCKHPAPLITLNNPGPFKQRINPSIDSQLDAAKGALIRASTTAPPVNQLLLTPWSILYSFPIPTSAPSNKALSSGAVRVRCGWSSHSW